MERKRLTSKYYPYKIEFKFSGKNVQVCKIPSLEKIDCDKYQRGRNKLLHNFIGNMTTLKVSISTDKAPKQKINSLSRCHNYLD